jgi:chromosome segregation protein
VFTHTSWAVDRGASYERLEFLGDSVLELAIARELYDRFPDASEGRLAKIRAHVVSRQSCAGVAKELELGKRLVARAHDIPDAELQRLSRSKNVLAAVLEAAIAATYLEYGFEAVESAVVSAFAERVEFARTSHVDNKTELQEALARSGKQVQYHVLAVEGPPHDRRFVCAAMIDGEQLGVGRGSTKKAAEQEAAHQVLAVDGDRARELLAATRSGGSSAAPAILPPVHLRSLRLRGFKSFPDSLELKLEPGVAVVVGPNGSGKSNIADAIVWAAGSLTPSELRAEKPDDVLFAGGGLRVAADHCEVELVFDNEDGLLAELDYTEVSIARRLVRGGEGQYLVNKTAMRRTDIVELLADVGLGGSMHSIVSQGKVDAVLASRPEDRRALVEEAAGLGKFKRRRHRAELKLARVAAQVERARDVEDEVRKRLRPLALQATAAERAEKLVAEIAGLRARIAQLDLEAVAARRIQAEERRDAAGLARRSTQERLSALLAERQQAEDELSDVAGKREAAVSALYRLQGAYERLGLRREAAGALESRLADDLTEHERAAAFGSDESVRALEAQAATAAAEARDAAQASGLATERARVAQARLAARERKDAARREAELESLRADRERVEAELRDATGGGDGAGRLLLAVGSARERIATRRESAVELARELRAELEQVRSAVRPGRQTPAELEAAANDAAGRARAAATERDEIAERARSARERLRTLERALAEHEGVAPAARQLAEEGETLLLGRIDVEPGSERAVAAALGWRASALLAPDASAGLALARQASQRGLGSLTVLIGHDPRDLVDQLPVVALERLLDSRHPAVTAEGFGYDPERGELWFAGETAEALLLEMEGRRKALADEADELAARAEAAARAAVEATAEAEVAEAAYREVAHLRGRPTDVALLGDLAALAAGAAETLDEIARHAATAEATLAARSGAAADRSATLTEELRELAGRESTARLESAEATTRAQAAELAVARLGGTTAVDAGDVGRESLSAEAAESLAAAEAASEEARAFADRARSAAAALAARVPRRPAGDPDLLVRLRSIVSSLAGELVRAQALTERLQAPVRARADAGAQRSSDLGTELRRLGASEVEMRQAAEIASERATEIEVELARLTAEADEAARRLEQVGQIEPADGDDAAELGARAERLEARREALGRVNPLAKEEYEAEKERLDELATQRADLEQSLAEVARLRDELADTVQRRFSETFDAVARNFEDVAATLFPGGEGQLRLVEPTEESGAADAADAGIEVELRPAGKRITRLSLLSGGEKALGAISFLFALFLAKPCPFYLLDEVEAALDDANIARFVELLRRYADRAQFVVITHQKRTMEAADVLYGVTMGADGVSEVVSRRLPRHEHQQAAAIA